MREKEGKEVMMIGDGINDILSLKESSVGGIGVSINTKSELNLIASDVVSLYENLWNIVYIFRLMKFTRIFIYINLCWAFAYNIFMIPVSAGLFYGANFVISP